MRRTLIVSVVAVALVLAGGVAYASIPGPDGVIHGCYKNTDGSARIIDSAASCPNGYTAINWTQTPTPTVATRVARHSAADGAFIPETVTCPAGKRAINGGVLQAQAVNWPGGSQSGGFARSDPGYEPDGTDDSVNLSLPRPVSNETGWRVLLAMSYPAGGYAMDVTLFAVCV